MPMTAGGHQADADPRRPPRPSGPGCAVRTDPRDVRLARLGVVGRVPSKARRPPGRARGRCRRRSSRVRWLSRPVIAGRPPWLERIAACRWAASTARARCRWVLTVPSPQPITSAMSASGRSSTYRNTTASRWARGNDRKRSTVAHRRAPARRHDRRVAPARAVTSAADSRRRRRPSLDDRLSATRRTHAAGLSSARDVGPPAFGLDERILGEVLGGRTIAAPGREHRDEPRVLVEEEVLERQRRSARRSPSHVHTPQTHQIGGHATPIFSAKSVWILGTVRGARATRLGHWGRWVRC